MAIQRIRPIGFSKRRSDSVLGYTSWPMRKQPTAQQLFEIAMAKNMERHSFMDKVRHAGSVAFSPVEWTFDKILRPSYAVAEAMRAATEAPGQQKLLELDMGKFAHGLREGFMGRKKTGFGQVLEQEGVLKGHRKLRGLAGFGFDVALDPTTYLSFGATAFAKGGAKGAHAAGRKVLNEGVSDIDELKTARRTLEKAGPDFKFRASLAKEQERWALKSTVDEGDRAVLNQARSAAKREELRASKHLPYARIGLIKTPTSVRGRQVVPGLPQPVKKLRTAKIPGVSKFVGGMRHAFGSELDDEIRGLRVTQKHTTEELSQEYLSTIRELTMKMPERFRKNKQRAIQALHHFERPGGVEKVTKADGSTDYVISQKRVDELKADPNVQFDELDEQFVKTWHDIAQYMHHTDESFGITYRHQGELGKLYVPHLVDRSGIPFSRAEKSLLKKAGYTKGRGHGDMSLAMIETAVKEGKLSREIETDPFKLLVTMARTRAHAHADMAAVNFLKRGIGVSSRVVGPTQRKRLAAAEKEIEEIEEKLLKYDTPSKKNLKQYRAGIAKLDELRSEAKRLRKGKKNEAAHRGLVYDLEGHGLLKDEFGNKVGFEPEIAQALKRVERIIDPTEDKTISNFAKALAEVQGRWKLLATAVNPGYRFRNTISDMWNMYVAGVPFWAMSRYSARAAKVMRDAKKGDEEAIRILSDAYKQGVLSGLFGGDIGTLARMLQYQGSKKSLIKRGRYLKLTSKVAQDTNRNAENWGRLIHYMYRREYEKLSPTDAAWHVKKAHFDYEDLTEFERQKIKGLFIPFYTWTRKNVPFQIKAMVERPGKYAAFPKFAQEAEYAAGAEDSGDIIPEYLASNFSFRVPFGKNTYYTPQIGAADLARFQSPTQALKSVGAMVTPFAKVPAELAFNKNLMTGADIEGTHPRNPISEFAAPLMSLIPGSNVGPTARGSGDDRVTGMGANPRMIHAMTQFPWARFGLTQFSNINRTRRGVGSEWSQILGVSATSIDREQQILIEQMELKDKLKRRMQGLRDEGRYPLAETRTSSYQKDINRQIQYGLGR
jgi:hypothetical protein